MQWVNDHGHRYLEGENWLIEPIEQWSQFFEPCNWYTIHPIKLELENDEVMGGFEITFIVLGLGLRWRWNHTETEQLAEIKETIAGIKSGEIEPVPVDMSPR